MRSAQELSLPFWSNSSPREARTAIAGRGQARSDDPGRTGATSAQVEFAAPYPGGERSPLVGGEGQYRALPVL